MDTENQTSLLCVIRHNVSIVYSPVLLQNTLHSRFWYTSICNISLLSRRRKKKKKTDHNLPSGYTFLLHRTWFFRCVHSCHWLPSVFKLACSVSMLRHNQIVAHTRAAICIVCIWKDDDRWSECSRSLETCHNTPLYESTTRRDTHTNTHTPLCIKVYYSSSLPHLQCNDI